MIKIKILELADDDLTVAQKILEIMFENIICKLTDDGSSMYFNYDTGDLVLCDEEESEIANIMVSHSSSWMKFRKAN